MSKNFKFGDLVALNVNFLQIKEGTRGRVIGYARGRIRVSISGSYDDLTEEIQVMFHGIEKYSM